MVQLSVQLVPKVGIDLGSSRIRIWSDRSEEILDEAACIAFDQKTQKVIAVGNEAYEMHGRVKPSILVSFPINQGKVVNSDHARQLLKLLLQKVLKRSFFSPTIMASVPARSTKVQDAIVTKLCYSLGAQEVYTISQPLAAAIGAEVPVADASGGFILQMGAGVVEAGVISLGSLVAYESTSSGGIMADERIRLSLMRNQQLTVSSETAQKLKKTIGAIGELKGRQLIVTGKDVVRGAPLELEISSAQLVEPLQQLADQYEQVLQKLLMKIPPGLTVDVVDKGLLLSGGFAKLPGWEQFLVTRLGVPVSVVDDPDKSVINGIATVLKHLKLFKQSLGYQV